MLPNIPVGLSDGICQIIDMRGFARNTIELQYLEVFPRPQGFHAFAFHIKPPVVDIIYLHTHPIKNLMNFVVNEVVAVEKFCATIMVSDRF